MCEFPTPLPYTVQPAPTECVTLPRAPAPDDISHNWRGSRRGAWRVPSDPGAPAPSGLRRSSDSDSPESSDLFLSRQRVGARGPRLWAFVGGEAHGPLPARVRHGRLQREHLPCGAVTDSPESSDLFSSRQRVGARGPRLWAFEGGEAHGPPCGAVTGTGPGTGPGTGTGTSTRRREGRRSGRGRWEGL